MDIIQPIALDPKDLAFLQWQEDLLRAIARAFLLRRDYLQPLLLPEHAGDDGRWRYTKGILTDGPHDAII